MKKDKQRRQQMIDQAGVRVIGFKEQGYHCSESSFLAINETLQITDPSMVRMVTGFHGGGGTRRKEPGVSLTSALEEAASGRDRRPPEELPFTQMGHFCGALAAGMICMGLLFGRELPTDDVTCVDELCYELHRRFLEELGENECHHLRKRWVPLSSNHSCEHVYRKAVKLAVELILNAEEIVPECSQRGSLCLRRVYRACSLHAFA